MVFSSVGTNSILMGSHKIRFLHLHGHRHHSEQKTHSSRGLDDLRHAKNVGNKKKTKKKEGWNGRNDDEILFFMYIPCLTKVCMYIAHKDD